MIKQGLFPYLFSDDDTNDANFGALVLDIEQRLTNEHTHDDYTITRELRLRILADDTFQGLLDWLDSRGQSEFPAHHAGTIRKLYRRLFKLVTEGDGILRRHDVSGNPLQLVASTTQDPVVIDLNGLTGLPSLQRFVVATVLRQLVEARTGTNAVRRLIYLVVLDELNRFAPRGSRDPITQLIEMVAAEMRSQGIILLGAQQQASKVSDKVVENAGIRVLGRSGALELDQPVWRFLSKGTRRKATALPLNEKLVIQDNFREPMHVRVPFPAWAMRPAEAAFEPSDDLDDIATY